MQFFYRTFYCNFFIELFSPWQTQASLPLLIWLTEKVSRHGKSKQACFAHLAYRKVSRYGKIKRAYLCSFGLPKKLDIKQKIVIFILDSIVQMCIFLKPNKMSLEAIMLCLPKRCSTKWQNRCQNCSKR